MDRLMGIYNKLYRHYGPQHWWPGDTRFEIVIGAILTQNTSWSNVEKAIVNMKPYLEPEILHRMDVNRLAEMIKPSGFFNVKANRIRNFLDWFSGKGYSFSRLMEMDVEELRKELLGINGVGRETADSIILYGLGKPVFVIDAYTRRLFGRLGFDMPDDYDDVRVIFENRLDRHEGLFNEYHALIVRHSKECCRKKPDCANCILASDCAAAAEKY
ncbi:MAG: Endonuclease III [Firmicutes bacterium]|nr:Endonuclease III [Bacillota bacterium]MDI6707271.1 endonuclease III domain-containing protein [Bacillota bacterium]